MYLCVCLYGNGMDRGELDLFKFQIRTTMMMMMMIMFMMGKGDNSSLLMVGGGPYPCN